MLGLLDHLNTGFPIPMYFVTGAGVCHGLQLPMKSLNSSTIVNWPMVTNNSIGKDCFQIIPHKACLSLFGLR
jgi:hypothetical protein